LLALGPLGQGREGKDPTSLQLLERDFGFLRITLKNLANNSPKCPKSWKKKKKFPTSAQILPHPGRGGTHVVTENETCQLLKCTRWPPLESAGLRCSPPSSLLPAGWLEGWAVSTCSRHPGGLAHPHWQCVDWQLGSESVSLEFPEGLDLTSPRSSMVGCPSPTS
jgi:hypothetical protein